MSIVTGANAPSCSSGMEKNNETRSKLANIKTRIKDSLFLPNSDFSHCFSSSYHVGVFKQGKFEKMHSLPLQLKHNLPSPLSRSIAQNVRSYPSYRVILSLLNSVPTINLMKGVAAPLTIRPHWKREMIFARHISIRPEEKWAQENLTALIFAAGVGLRRPGALFALVCGSGARQSCKGGGGCFK